jgi:hypothetical protein
MFYEYTPIPYTQNCCLNNECPITHQVFRETIDNIVCLPCNHGFEPVSIHRWLFHYKKRECPVCRCPILMFDDNDTNELNELNEYEHNDIRRQYNLSTSTSILLQWVMDTFYRDGIYINDTPETIDDTMFKTYVQSLSNSSSNVCNVTHSISTPSSSPIPIQYFPFHLMQ